MREPRHDLTLLRGFGYLVLMVMLVWLATAMLRAANWGLR